MTKKYNDRRSMYPATAIYLLGAFALSIALLGVCTAQSAPERGTTAWWEAETAMGKGGMLDVSAKPWWQRAKSLKPGEHFQIKSELPGGGFMLVRRERLTRPKCDAVVWVIDDDGDMKPDDKDGDKDSDCYVVDYDADGRIDRMVDYLDDDADGKPNEMDIRYFVDGRLRRGWFGLDLDGDDDMWNVQQYEYKGNFFLCDAYGNGMIYFNGYDAELGRWFPASECPFDFHDTDGDGQSEAVVRVSGVPLSYDPQQHGLDCANNVDYSSEPRTEATRKIGALNIRYSIDIDGLSCKERPLHYDMGFNLIGRLPYDFPGMNHENPLRRAPKTTVVIPHEASRAMAESYPAEQTGFSWREFWDDSRTLGFGPTAEEDRRWEGIFWTWSRRIMHNTGGPTQTWNVRREFCGTPSTRRELYYSRVDRRIHLKGASEGWVRIGHFGNRKTLGEIRSFDTDGDGYFDRWEVFRKGSTAPIRATNVGDPGVRELPGDWDKLSELYVKELLPEALQANEAIILAMQAADPEYVVPAELQTAQKSATDDTERRYIQDIIRECRYQHLREKLLQESGEPLQPDNADRIRNLVPPCAIAWDLAVQLARLDTAYGEGRLRDAAEIIKAIAAAREKKNKKSLAVRPIACTKKTQSEPSGPSQGVWYTPGVADGYGRGRPDKSYPSEKYARVYPGKPTVYSGPMATYCAWHHPMAVYAPSQDKTFFVFGNPQNSPTISYYDHVKKTFAALVIVGSNPNGDAHRNPTLLIDEQGFLYVFYGAHGGPSHIVKSASPFDISRWQKMADISDSNTYPQPWQLRAGELFVSYRGAAYGGSGGWFYRRSSDGAASWQPPVHLVKFPGSDVYAISAVESGSYPRKIHIAWERMGGGTPEEIRTKALWARRYNVYYAYSDDGGDTWRRSDGSVYKLPIDESAAEIIHDSGQNGVWLNDVKLDPAGNPYVLFTDADTETYRCQWKVARLIDGRWLVSDVTASDHMYDGGAILPLAVDDVRVYGATTAVQDHEDGGEIEEWRSPDRGATWTNSRHVTSGSQLSHNHVKTVFNQPRGSDFQMIWSYGDSVYPPSTKNVYLYYFGAAMDVPRQMRFSGPASKAVFIDAEKASLQNGSKQVTVALDRCYNNEKLKGKPYHYAWEDASMGGYSQLGELIRSLGAKTTSLSAPASHESLADTDIYIIVDPDTPKENPKPHYITDADIDAIAAWVKAGGVLLLLNNNSGETEFEHMNKLAGRFGITFNEDTRLGVDADPEKLRRQLHSLPDHPFFTGVKKLHMRSLCTLNVKAPAESLYSLEGDCFMALARYGKGTVLAVGDPWGYNEYINHADNLRCLKNVYGSFIEQAKKSTH